MAVPRRASQRGALHAALEQLAEQDPLIHVRQDDVRRELSVSLFGEVQKEVIQATLASDFGIDVDFRETTTVCIERVVGIGEAVEVIDVPPNPFLATVGLRVGPGDVGSGVDFGLGIELGSLPLAFLRAVEQTVRVTLHQGLSGWDVPDATVTIVRSGYWPRQSHSHGSFDKTMSSTAGDFRHLTPLVLMSALRKAGTVVCEPIDRFTLEIPADTIGATAPLLARMDAVPLGQEAHGTFVALVGEVPASRVHELRQRLPALTRGEAPLTCVFDHHRPVRGAIPTRSRSDFICLTVRSTCCVSRGACSYQTSLWITSSNGRRAGRSTGAIGRSAGMPSAINITHSRSGGSSSNARAMAWSPTAE